MGYKAVCIIRGDAGVEGLIYFIQSNAGDPTVIEGE